MDNNCKTEGCKRCAFRLDTNERGVPVVVFQTRHDSAKHNQVFTAEELEKMAKVLRSGKSIPAKFGF